MLDSVKARFSLDESVFDVDHQTEIFESVSIPKQDIGILYYIVILLSNTTGDGAQQVLERQEDLMGLSECAGNGGQAQHVALMTTCGHTDCKVIGKHYSCHSMESLNY